VACYKHLQSSSRWDDRIIAGNLLKKTALPGVLLYLTDGSLQISAVSLAEARALKNQYRKRWYQIGVLAGSLLVEGAIACFILLFADGAAAQRRPIADNTLGGESTVVVPDQEIRGVLSDRIEGGARRGANLFHSFREFSVEAGRAAYFANPGGVDTILSRVTGEVRSDILGNLGVLGNATLIFVNPNGVVFGPNAQLDVNASFIATTANHVQLGDQGYFSASDPDSSRLLRVDPSALWFNRTSNGTIVNRSRSPSPDNQLNTLSGFPGLRIPSQQTLALVGGDVDLSGGNLTTFGGNIHLGSVEHGRVGLRQQGDRWTFNYGDVENFGSIHLTDNSAREATVVEAGVEGGGSIQVRADNLVIRNGSRLSTRPSRGQLSGGDITINTASSVLLSGITIFSDDFALPGGVFSSSTGEGQDAGEISIQTRRLRVENGAAISSAAFANGRNGGNTTINAEESIQIIGVGVGGEQLFNSVIGAGTFSGDTGGDITLNTRRLTVRDGASIVIADINGLRGGQLIINAAESVVLSGRSGPLEFSFGTTEIPSGFYADTLSGVDRPPGVQEAGRIEINTRRLLVSDGAFISVSTWGKGQGGNLIINASESVRIRDFTQERGESSDRFISGLYAQSFGSGTSGSLEINSPNVDIRNGGRVTVASSNFDQVGISVETLVQLFNAFLPDLCLNCLLDESTIGTGNAGNLTVNADIIRLDNQGQITAAASAGEGGNIFLTGLHDQPIDLLLLRRSSQVSTTAGTLQAGGNGGDISISAEFLVSAPSENSDIAANAFDGQGGTINITAASLFNLNLRSREELETLLETTEPSQLDPARLPSNDITAISQTNPQLSGSITLDALDLNPEQGLVELPEQPITTQLNQVCQSAELGDRPQSEFMITGRGGLPPRPEAVHSGDNSYVDLVTADAAEATLPSRHYTPSAALSIVEAQGWVVAADGTVTLTAAPLAPPVPPLREPLFHCPERRAAGW